MNQRPKLIMLGGFAGCGKTTIANKYVSETPLALNIDGDEIITKLGQWRKNIHDAVASRLSLTSAMAEAHLRDGHDVILPFLLRDAGVAKHYEEVAHSAGAHFIEILLSVEKSEAIQRLLQRGTWGEEGLPPITEEDIPKIEKLYDGMMEAVSYRPHMMCIESKENDIESTYKDFLTAITQ
ncbi:MAG: AAA family ATPase [Candidatus Moranbacteria bacterium]|nr:AAA family ATPase [Candidatus Moranbacteria bacterium]